MAGRFNYRKELASWLQIARRSKAVQNILWDLFYTTPALREFPDHLAVGLKRIEEQSLLAQSLGNHMEERGNENVEAFLSALHGDAHPNYVECFSEFRYPLVLWLKNTKEDREYLLSVCGLKWDEHKKEYVTLQERPT